MNATLPKSWEVAECIPVFDAVVAGVGFGEFWEFAVVPFEFAAVNDYAADACAVSADVFGG